jgi:hypothetical protein
MKKVTKAVFPVAGMGTRFLPATKASPKEMMPIVDKPLIQYAVEEAVAAGITDMIFVTGRSKRAIEDHFDKAYELESELAARGKLELLEFVRNLLPKNINCIYIRQAEALGLGHAVLCAKPAVGDEPFAVLLADDEADGRRFQLLPLLGARRAGCAAGRYAQLRHCRLEATGGPGRADFGHRRKAETRGCAVDTGRGWPLCADAAHLPSSGERATRFRR